MSYIFQINHKLKTPKICDKLWKQAQRWVYRSWLPAFSPRTAVSSWQALVNRSVLQGELISTGKESQSPALHPSNHAFLSVLHRSHLPSCETSILCFHSTPVSTPDMSVCIPSHKKLFWHLCPEARGTRVGACFLVCLSFIFLCVNVLWVTKTQIKPWLKPSYLSPCSFMCLVYLSITLLHAHRQAEQSVNRVKSQTAWAPSAPAVPSWLVFTCTHS